MKWDSTIERVIRSVNVLAAGSVVVEVGFLKFNVVKNQRRTSISDMHLQAILRILLNGPDKIDDFDGARHADLWIKAGKYTPDMVPPFSNLPDEDVDDVSENLVDEVDPSEVSDFQDVAEDDMSKQTEELESLVNKRSYFRLRSVLV